MKKVFSALIIVLVMSNNGLYAMKAVTQKQGFFATADNALVDAQDERWCKAREFIAHAQITKVPEEKLNKLQQAQSILEQAIPEGNKALNNELAVVYIQKSRLVEDILERRMLLQSAQRLAVALSRHAAFMDSLKTSTVEFNAMVAYLEEAKLVESSEEKKRLLNAARWHLKQSGDADDRIKPILSKVLQGKNASSKRTKLL